MENENIAEFVPLVDHEDYEILSVYPFTIRRKDNHYEVKEGIVQNGYVRVHLNNICYLKHRLVALQFLHNDDPVNKTDVDHINRDRSDYHLSNLRWCTRSKNNMNRTSSLQIEYTYTNIPDNSLKVTDYNEHSFEDYYFYDNNFYFYNGLNYRLLHVNTNSHGSKFVSMMNTNGIRIKVYFSKFKKMYDLE